VIPPLVALSETLFEPALRLATLIEPPWTARLSPKVAVLIVNDSRTSRARPNDDARKCRGKLVDFGLSEVECPGGEIANANRRGVEGRLKRYLLRSGEACAGVQRD
jgi:hypothetical protein